MSVVSVQLLVLDHSHCSVWEECAIEMLKRINIFTVWRERCLPVTTSWPHIDDIQPVCLSGVRCHSILTSLMCKMYLTGQGELQKVGQGGAVHVCFCSTASWPRFDLEGPSKKEMFVTLPLTRTHTILPSAWSCVVMERTLFIRANLCCWETLNPIQHRRFPFKHHPSLSWIPLALKKDPGSLKSGRGPEPFKVYPMPRAQQGS